MSRADWGALEALAPPRRRAMAFLRDHLPESDLDCYPFALFLQFADHALSLRERVPWCRELEEELFFHYVLFPRVNDEDLSFHREIFSAELWPRVRDLQAPEDRVLEVNRWCHEHASYQPQDERTASPLTVCRCGSGRCGEQSAFLVSALRSVGIPARQVYAPRWSHCDDNHAWVEALCGGRWRFLGACEPEPVLDRGWFNTAASRAVLVHSRLFGGGDHPLHGQPIGREGGVFYYNQTARYAPTRPYTFRVLLGDRPAPGAEIRLQLLNEASFHTIAVLTADPDGCARAELGLGDLHVLASLGELAAEGDCADGAVTLRLVPPAAGGTWQVFDFHAPTGHRTPPVPLDAARRARRAEVLSRGNALRAARLDALFSPEKSRPQWDGLLRAARGNFDQIRTFLLGERSADRVRFLRTLSDKDLRDTPAGVLEDHFSRLPPRPPEVPEVVYWDAVACPRIALEKLTAWRGPLRKYLAGWTGAPAALWSRLEGELALRYARLYANLYWPPDQALAAGGCDEKSLRVLLVAALRTLGVPARLRPMDGEPEFWQGGAFRPVRPRETAVLRLTWSGEAPPLYRQNWTLSRRAGTGWRCMELSGADWRALTLPAGQYRLLLSTRLPNGSQLALRRDLTLEAGSEQSLTLRPRPFDLEAALCCQDLPALPARTLDGEQVDNIFAPSGRPAILLWLEEGGEPTEHILGELMESGEPLWEVPMTLLLRSRESVCHPALSRLLARRPSIRVLLDDWAYDLSLLARHLARDPDTPPLIVVCGRDGRAVYSFSGYQVGAVELLERIAAHLNP